MSSHVHNNGMANDSHAQRLPVVPVAAVVGVLSAVVLFLLHFPFLVAGGLWLLILALTLIVYALISQLRWNLEAWHIAIAGQIIGLCGLALLFIASLFA
ncbi:MAG: hypothetical protein R3293_15465 [Candidatus Promineifilaceae bacterium]|nr:hypothetical protein [Candidatus Promineifilaceae bacterium]